MRIPTISRVRFVRGDGGDARTGLLGFVSFVVDGCWLMDSVSVRRSPTGGLRLGYPERKSSRSGIRHPIIAPLAEEVRQGVEVQVLDAIEHEVGR